MAPLRRRRSVDGTDERSVDRSADQFQFNEITVDCDDMSAAQFSQWREDIVAAVQQLDEIEFTQVHVVSVAAEAAKAK